MTYIVAFLVLVVCLSSALHAQRQRTAISRDVDELVAAVEIHTDEGPSEAHGKKLSGDIFELVEEVVESEEHGVAVLAVNELTGRADLARSRTLALTRGLPRVCFLSGAAGAFFVVALGSFERSAFVLAGACMVVGLSSSAFARVFSNKARALAKKYGGLTDVLARQVEARFREPN